MVAAAKKGRRPSRRSRAINSANGEGRMAQTSSQGTKRRRSWSIPAMRAPFSTEEWVCSDRKRVSRGAPSFPYRDRAFSRAARMAQRAALEALSWMTPPPGPVERNFPGRPQSPAIQSMTRVSSSVQAGEVAQDMPWTPSPAESISPSTEGPEMLLGKKAKKLGDCQWVRPGRMTSSTSRITSAKGSPVSGAFSGSRAAVSPGRTRDATGKVSTRSQ